MFYDPAATYPNAKPTIGRWIGPAIDDGSAMTHKVLKASGEYVCRTTVRAWTPTEEAERDLLSQRQAYMESILVRCGPGATIDDFPKEAITPEYEYYADDHQEDGFEGTSDKILLPTPEFKDNYVGANILLSRGEGMAKGTVRKRARNSENNPVGRANQNPILDTREYVVEFEDGQEAELTANTIAQSMYAQCDQDGNTMQLFDSLVDFRRCTTALCYSDQRARKADGRTFMHRSTKGWQLCVQWKDGLTSWEKLSDLKESHPIEVAEYTVVQSLELEPAFNWWVPQVLKKRERIIALVKKHSVHYLKRHEKFGIAITRSVEEALEFDKNNKNTYWADAIAKEMENIKVAFNIQEDGEQVPSGYQFVRCHMIFTIKMEDFRRKACFVAGGPMTKAPATITYASVVSRELVRIALTIAALNDLQVQVSDVLNAYITAPVTEKIYTTLGPEFGDNRGKTAIIVRALYGLKSSDAAFRRHLGDCMLSLGYTPCLADPDLCLKA